MNGGGYQNTHTYTVYRDWIKLIALGNVVQKLGLSSFKHMRNVKREMYI